MPTAPLLAARLRGVMVGAVSGAAALPAHGLGGGMLPSSSAMVMLVSGCILLGVLCSHRAGAGLGMLMGQLAIGQGIGHLLLMAATPEHHHGATLSASMLSSHLAVAVIAGLGLWIAEHLVRVVVASVTRWLAVLVTPVPRELSRHQPCRTTLPIPRRLLLSSGAGTRGPPALMPAV
ncbi:hypothetical protein MHN80_02770 [Gordonia McavH-238-E]|uniref:hypothetical protein n=1 Tax=Gordonia sp. McavH-238-E TaxID=2917736 RepID=UPI001EF56926|nr:hypothetical protein [Gordonia sp. McavH-238-E]MCG7631224.1 hypothetical protein [Gordonia sp. McavH-238-E]